MEATLTIFQNGDAYYTSWISQTHALNLHRADQNSQGAICLAGIIRCDAQKTALLHQQIDAAIQTLTLKTPPGGQPSTPDAAVAQTNALSGLGWLLFSQLIPPPSSNRSAPWPGSVLHIVTNDANLPWELLHDGDEFLSLKHVAARLPILVRAQAEYKLMRSNAKASCLLLCNPTGDLPAAEDEIAAIEDTLYAAKERVRYLTLYGANITTIQLQNLLAAEGYDLIHYAGHATPDALHLADGHFSIDEIRIALPNHPIVVLNACATGRTQPGANMADITSGAQTLAAAFIEAGAPAVIGMLWPVPDETSRHFAQVLYRHLVDGHPVGQALWQSRLEMYRRDPNGIGWMAPVLYGNPAWQLAPLAPRRAAGAVLTMRFDQPSTDAATLTERAQTIAQICAEISRHGGFILAANQAELLAVFGLYMINDLNTVQAVEAARRVIALENERGGRLPVVGLASGDLMITTPPATSTGAISAAPILMGEAVAEARRLLAAAMPGQLLVNPRGYARVKERFNFRPWSVVGSTDATVSAYELISTPVNVPSAPPELNVGATVGRDAELHRLVEAWQQVRNGHGRAVGIRGEAGIGKTHLVQTFKQQTALAPPQWIQVSCSLNVQNTPYGLLLRLLRVLLELPENAEAAQIEAALDAHFTDQAVATTSMLGELLGVQPPSAVRQEQSVYQHQLFQLVAHLLAQRLAEGPIVLVLEDAHWSDPASLDVLTILAGQLEEVAILVLLIHRTSWQSPWHGRDFFQSIHLPPLEPAARQQLYQSLLQTAELPGELAAMLGRTSGNPLFLREILLTLMQKGLLTQSDDTAQHWRLGGALEARDLPDSIQLVIDMRLSQLEPTARQVLNMAAVLGTNILPELLQGGLAMPEANLLAALRVLTEKDFLRRPFGSRAYEFRHDLIRDVAYMKIPVAQRQVWHRQTAQMLEVVDSERRESISLLAHHYYLSLVENDDTLPALNEASDPTLIEKSLTYLIKSGQNALGSYGGHEAVAHYTRARQVNALCTDAHQRQAEILSGLGDAHHMLSHFDAAERTHQQAHSSLHMQPLAPQSRCLAADLARRLARSFMRQAKYDMAEAWIETGLGYVAGREDEKYRPTEALLHIHAGSLLYDKGNHERALQRCRTGVSIAEMCADVGACAEGYHMLGAITHALGRLDQALSYYLRSWEFREQLGNLDKNARLELAIGVAYFDQGEWDAAELHFQTAGEICKEIGAQELLGYFYPNIGLIHKYRGNWTDAEDCYLKGLQIWQTANSQRWVAQCRNNLGSLYIEQGLWQKAAMHLELSRELLIAYGIEDLLPDVLCSLAQAALGNDNIEAACEWGKRAYELAVSHNKRREQAHALQLLARINIAKGQIESAHTHLNEARDILHAGSNRYEVARIWCAEAELAVLGQKVERAIGLYKDAERVFRELGASNDLKRVQHWLESLPTQTGSPSQSGER
ncbi:MAG: CHAT domain-containing protein [Caldilineaceae bacterium]